MLQEKSRLEQHFDGLIRKDWSREELLLGCQDRARILANRAHIGDNIERGRIRLLQVFAPQNGYLRLRGIPDVAWDRFHEVVVVDERVFDPLHGRICSVEEYLRDAFEGQSFKAEEVLFLAY